MCVYHSDAVMGCGSTRIVTSLTIDRPGISAADNPASCPRVIDLAFGAVS